MYVSVSMFGKGLCPPPPDNTLLTVFLMSPGQVSKYADKSFKWHHHDKPKKTTWQHINGKHLPYILRKQPVRYIVKALYTKGGEVFTWWRRLINQRGQKNGSVTLCVTICRGEDGALLLPRRFDSQVSAVTEKPHVERQLNLNFRASPVLLPFFRILPGNWDHRLTPSPWSLPAWDYYMRHYCTWHIARRKENNETSFISQALPPHTCHHHLLSLFTTRESCASYLQSITLKTNAKGA